ncbi:MAG: alpha-N-arabinofuranosidase, partial [Verrucomicrobiae bacterium]|nr:alpha-N-arabinofuranosidase [Verrucomicrobiae bacterium]
FNRHCDRVRMANIAQTINVLQAMILTDKEKMLLTPTYHVFEMYVPHHDATWLPDELACADYAMGEEKMPAVNVSASRDGTGRIHVTLCNLDPSRPAPIDCELRGAKASRISGRMLTAPDIAAHNTFDQPDRVKPAPFTDARPSEKGFSATLPPKSVVAIEIAP